MGLGYWGLALIGIVLYFIYDVYRDIKHRRRWAKPSPRVDWKKSLKTHIDFACSEAMREEIGEELKETRELIDELATIIDRYNRCVEFRLKRKRPEKVTREIALAIEHFTRMVNVSPPLLAVVTIRCALLEISKELAVLEAGRKLSRKRFLGQIWRLRAEVVNVNLTHLDVESEIDTTRYERKNLLYRISRFQHEQIESWERRIQYSWEHEIG